MRIVSWNVARLSARLAEQAAALAGRDPDVVALQEISRRTLPLWRAALAALGLTHIRASLDSADPGRQPAARRRTGVLLGSRAPLTEASTSLPVPWPETALAATTSSVAAGVVELHCVHVPNAANGWVKVRTLEAIRSGLAGSPPVGRVLCGDLNTPRRELPSGEVISFARDSRGRLRPDRGTEWDDAELGVVPARLCGQRAELDMAAHSRPWRGLASRSSLRVEGASPGYSGVPPRMARPGAQRSLAARGRPT